MIKIEQENYGLACTGPINRTSIFHGQRVDSVIFPPSVTLAGAMSGNHQKPVREELDAKLVCYKRLMVDQSNESDALHGPSGTS